MINDAADRKQVKGFIAELGESQATYFIIPLILLIININYWIILVVSMGHILSYETTKYFFKKKGYH